MPTFCFFANSGDPRDVVDWDLEAINHAGCLSEAGKLEGKKTENKK